MSRTIKFRGKRFDNGGWVYGNLIIDDSGNCEIVDYKNNREIRYDVRGETVGQFTGLCDRNGREIYENDVIKSMYNDIYHAIRYNDLIAAFSAVLINQYMYDNDGLRTECHITEAWIGDCTKVVVGNIHDNPELLYSKQTVKGVVLFGYPFLFQNGDLDFHEKMEKLGLTRGSTILCGLPNKCILANKHEYLLTDYDKEQDLCEQFKLKATYSVKDFIQGIKELKSEVGKQ